MTPRSELNHEDASASRKEVEAKTGPPKTYAVVIPALNEDRNIGRLLDDILGQEPGPSLALDKVIVVSDHSTDNTDSIVRLKAGEDARVQLIVNLQTVGQAQSINIGKRSSTSDYVILLDADVRLENAGTLRNLLEGFGPGVALTGGNPTPASGKRNLATLASERGDYILSAVGRRIKGGHNIYSAHGRCLALDRGLYEGIEVPRHPDPGNLLIAADQFFYLSCIRMGKRFVFRPGARVLYNLPATLRDYLRQITRFHFSTASIKSFFGEELVVSEYPIPLWVKVCVLAEAFKQNPMSTAVWAGIQAYGILELLFMHHVLRKGVDAAWEVSETTKDAIGDK